MAKKSLIQKSVRQQIEIVKIAGDLIQISDGQQRIVCAGDELYFALLEALATAGSVSVDVLILSCGAMQTKKLTIMPAG